jgi:hypothetical protein
VLFPYISDASQGEAMLWPFVFVTECGSYLAQES